jgi:integrase
MHPDQHASKLFRVQFGRDICKRFAHYRLAERFLDGLRYEVDKGTFDALDYQASNPLGFNNLVDKWLILKKKELKPGSFKNLNNYMTKAKATWQGTNIKALGYGEFEDFLFAQDVSDKTRNNMRSCLHSFWNWLLRRKVIDRSQFPDFPEISFELGWRQTIDKKTQHAILDELKRITKDIDFRVWLGIKWLSTYISIRPNELLNLREKHINTQQGSFVIPHPKEKHAKVVPLIDEDIRLLKKLPQGLPDLFFFRHPHGVSGCKAGQQYGQRYFYKWWKKACKNLGVENVDLYGGTRHSTAMALRDHATPEQIKRATFHATNKAFERYYRIERDEVKSIYELASNGK